MTIDYMTRRAIRSLSYDMTPKELAMGFDVSINSVKRILEEPNPPKSWNVILADHKRNSVPSTHWTYGYFKRESYVAWTCDQSNLTETVCYALSSLEEAEPYNCKWGYLRQKHLAYWVKILEAQGSILKLDKAPEQWIKARREDRSGARQPKGYTPYNIPTEGRGVYWGYRYDPGEDKLYNDTALLRESWVGLSAINLGDEIQESIEHYTSMADKQKANGSKSYLTWIKLSSQATENIHNLTVIKDTWRGWHYGHGQSIQWRDI